MKLHITDYILSPFILLILVAAYVVIGAVCWAWSAWKGEGDSTPDLAHDGKKNA